MNTPEIDHSAYPRSLKAKTANALRHIIADCRQALQAMPDNPKAGYYADEIHYCAMQLQRRRDGKP